MENEFLITDAPRALESALADEALGMMRATVSLERNYYCHPNALVDDGVTVGRGLRIWAFVHLLSGVKVGADCNVCDHCFIEGNVRVGDRVTIKCGVSLWDGMTVENDVFIGPNACFTNDIRPRSKQYPVEYPQTVLREGCTMGGNSTTLPGVTIGRWAMVGAGAVVTRSVTNYGWVLGNPARLVGWVCSCGANLPAAVERQLVCSCGQVFEQTGEREIERVTE